MTDLIITHQTDTYLARDTRLFQGTDTFKTKIAPTTHSTDADLLASGQHVHSTSAFLRTQMAPAHSTDVSKWTTLAPATDTNQPIGTVLADTIEGSSGLNKPELSKNASTYLGIGSGLSVLIGLPRIPTWNTLGRPKQPKVGTIGLNTQTRCLEFWDGNIWIAMPMDRL